MNLSIREAQTTDWKAIQRVAYTAFEGVKEYDPDYDINWPYSKAGIKHYKSVTSSKINCKLVADVDRYSDWLFNRRKIYLCVP